MKTTLFMIQALDDECAKLIADGKASEAAEISDMIVRAHKDGRVEDDAWAYFWTARGIANSFI